MKIIGLYQVSTLLSQKGRWKLENEVARSCFKLFGQENVTGGVYSRSRKQEYFFKEG